MRARLLHEERTSHGDPAHQRHTYVTAMLDAGVDLCDVVETTTMLGVSAVLVFLGVALRAATRAAFDREHISTRWSHAASGLGGRLLLSALPQPA